MRLYVIAEVPENLVNKWLQYMRDWDQQPEHKEAGCHFEVAADAPNLSLKEMVELIRVDPELTFTKLFTRPNFNQDD